MFLNEMVEVRAWLLIALWAGCVAGVILAAAALTGRWRWKRRRRAIRRAVPLDRRSDLIRRGRES